MRRPATAAPGRLTTAGRCKECGWTSADCDCGEIVGAELDAGPFEEDGAEGTRLLELDFDE
jgi:hypothetical protein